MVEIEGQVTIDDVEKVLKAFSATNPEGSFLVSIEDAEGYGFSTLEGYKGRLSKTLFNMLMVDKEEHMIACLNEATKMYMIEQKRQDSMKRISLTHKGVRNDN